MNKNKKLIILIISICLLIIITCIILIATRKKEKNENSEIQENSQSIITVQNLMDVKRTYNIEKCVNEMIEDTYYYHNNENSFLSTNLIKYLELDQGLYNFNIKNVYYASLEDNINIYFTKGQLIDKLSEYKIKKDVSLTIINDDEYNTCRLYLYGAEYKDMFKYNDDISKTQILKTTGLKIKKSESGRKKLDELMMEDKFFQKNLSENISEYDLVSWYYRDYKIKQANEGGEKYDGMISFTYTGSYEEGYTIKESDKTEYFIKPGDIPMDYTARKVN